MPLSNEYNTAALQESLVYPQNHNYHAAQTTSELREGKDMLALTVGARWTRGDVHEPGSTSYCTTSIKCFQKKRCICL